MKNIKLNQMNKVEKETFKLMYGDKFVYICVGALIAIILGLIFPFIYQSSDGSSFGTWAYFGIYGAVALGSGIGGYISFKPVAEREFQRGEL